MVSVECRNLTKSFGYRCVLEGVCLRVEQGETLVVTGRNGAGKTTLLRLIAGLSKPTRGEVVIAVNGQPLDSEEVHRHVGFVTPDLSLYAELTALENLAFFAALRGLPTQRHDARCLHEYLGAVGLLERADDLLRDFSSGLKQRLKLAFAVLHRPAVLLLDEPTSNLDAAGVEIVERLIRDQKQRGVVILATNNAEELKHGDQILRLSP
ncbi:MAG: heme ABC exporter ATP-binding protein CcmA [Abditibacteriales bacterium]|nr:heme ABC exporter ATP-binding protein CcmA [Abditibacteriales bacterium]MDW8366112.1 heme ABC exporter ATP-binding protein CcmA [Abditibacteriales bacterium]